MYTVYLTVLLTTVVRTCESSLFCFIIYYVFNVYNISRKGVIRNHNIYVLYDTPATY